MSARATPVIAGGIVAVAVLVLAGCSTAPTPATVGADSEGFGHVHGVVDLGDGTVLLGTHNGLYTLTENGTLAGPVGGNDFDAMGLAGGGDSLFASGHPGPTTPARFGAHNLGIIRSTDAGITWEPVAFTGQEDFHVLTATGDGALFGMGSSSTTVRTSPDGGKTWIDGADLPVADLAVTTDGGLYAATRNGVQESRDGGATFAPVSGTPLAYLLEADPGGGLVGVATDGTLWRSPGTASWEKFGTVTGTVQALGTTAGGVVVLVDDRGVVWIRGSQATVVLPSGGTL